MRTTDTAEGTRMRPTHAKNHPATAPPRLVAVAEAPVASPLCRPVVDGGAGHGTTEAWPAASGPLPTGSAEVRQVDADVPGAVGRMLDHVLAERLHRARLADPLFAEELAERVTRFTLEGGKRTRAQLVWWASRACAGRDPASAAAALRIGGALELLQTCALVHDDVMDRAVLRRGRPAPHTDVADWYADRLGRERAERFGQSGLSGARGVPEPARRVPATRISVASEPRTPHPARETPRKTRPLQLAGRAAPDSPRTARTRFCRGQTRLPLAQGAELSAQRDRRTPPIAGRSSRPARERPRARPEGSSPSDLPYPIPSDLRIRQVQRRAGVHTLKRNVQRSAPTCKNVGHADRIQHRSSTVGTHPAHPVRHAAEEDACEPVTAGRMAFCMTSRQRSHASGPGDRRCLRWS
ncbi:polyprenyl synthetase family protein [Streptomyces sp. NEAU-YJ-81]|uniref:polyprenyl synthetase family protein n=1 Tax=Streptomyces sp. NEAU-YJ-81 TaxID=2820288 RepID=UPI0035B1A431